MKTSDLVAIEKYLFFDEGVVLDARLEKKLEILKRTHELIEEWIYKWKVIEKLRQEYKITMPQALVIYQEAYELFNIQEQDLYINRLNKTWTQAKIRSEKFPAQTEIMAKIDIHILKYLQNKEKTESDAIKTWKPNTYIIGFFPDVLNIPMPADYEKRLDEILERYGNSQTQVLEAHQPAGE